MLDFSFADIALIVVVAVLFIGPHELPVVIRTVGKAMRTMRGLVKEMRGIFDEISRESGLEEVAKDITMIKGDDGKMYESYNHPINPTKLTPAAKPEDKPEVQHE